MHSHIDRELGFPVCVAAVSSFRQGAASLGKPQGFTRFFGYRKVDSRFRQLIRK